MQLRVEAIRLLTADIRSFVLVHPAGAELPPFAPGAHLKLRVLPGGASPLQRHYSLVGAPQDRHRYEIAVLRQPRGRGGSSWMHDAVEVGHLLDIDGPHNGFALAPQASRSVLVAGGIGITPLLCMARELTHRGMPTQLHYFGRSLQAMAYRDALQALPGLELREWVGLDAAASVNALRRCIGRAEPGVHLYVCGPAAMLDAALDIAEHQEWSAGQVHHERFGAVAGGPGDQAFSVELRQRALRLEITSDQTLLDVLLAHGVDVAHDCRAGQCGSCFVPVASGRILHRDSVLTEADRAGGDLMCACVSRADGLLSLDL